MCGVEQEENIVVNWAPFVWKKIAGQQFTPEDYAKGIDRSLTLCGGAPRHTTTQR